MISAASTISTDLFSYANRTFTADASDLRGKTFIGRLFDDACDVGLRLKSPRTGAVKNFILVKEEKDKEGDTICWLYLSDKAVGKQEELKMVIFND